MADNTQVSANEILLNVRKTLVLLKIDPNAVKASFAGTTLTLSGNIKFVGKQVNPQEMPRELKKIEERMKDIKQIKKINIQLETFEKNDTGDYAMTGAYKTKLLRDERDRIKAMKDGGGKKKTVSKYAPICANKQCAQTINFCPHCGDALDLKLMIKAAEKLLAKGGGTATSDELMDAFNTEKKAAAPVNSDWDMSSLEADAKKFEEEEAREMAERKGQVDDGKIKGVEEFKLGSPQPKAPPVDDDPKSKILEALRKKKESEFQDRKNRAATDDLGSINWDKIPTSDKDK